MVASVVVIGACRTSELTKGDSKPPDCIAIGRPVMRPATAKLHPGDTLRPVTDMGSPPCDSPGPHEFRWASSDTGVASVDSVAGLVLARKQGITTITATHVRDRSVRGAMVVEVTP